jgi:hypothetical protein
MDHRRVAVVWEGSMAAKISCKNLPANNLSFHFHWNLHPAWSRSEVQLAFERREPQLIMIIVLADVINHVKCASGFPVQLPLAPTGLPICGIPVEKKEKNPQIRPLHSSDFVFQLPMVSSDGLVGSVWKDAFSEKSA